MLMREKMIFILFAFHCLSNDIIAIIFFLLRGNAVCSYDLISFIFTSGTHDLLTPACIRGTYNQLRDKGQ